MKKTIVIISIITCITVLIGCTHKKVETNSSDSEKKLSDSATSSFKELVIPSSVETTKDKNSSSYTINDHELLCASQTNEKLLYNHVDFIDLNIGLLVPYTVVDAFKVKSLPYLNNEDELLDNSKITENTIYIANNSKNMMNFINFTSNGGFLWVEKKTTTNKLMKQLKKATDEEIIDWLYPISSKMIYEDELTKYKNEDTIELITKEKTSYLLTDSESDNYFSGYRKTIITKNCIYTISYCEPTPYTGEYKSLDIINSVHLLNTSSNE